MSTCREDHEDWCPAKHLDAQPCACMRRQIDAALALHTPTCDLCGAPARQCTHDHLVCPICDTYLSDEPEPHPYPCPTARALGVRAPSETTGDPA